MMATKKRLMNIDDFKRNLCHYCNTYMSDEPCEPGECWVYDVIAQTGSVDAVEVVHGRWVLAKPRVKGRNATYRCTACGKLRSSYYNDVFQWEYCPCGAKMDGDNNGS